MITKTIVVTLCLPILIFSQTKVYRNLIFEGGGMRGLAYCGVIKELEDHRMIDSIQNVGGTSAGAIISLALCLGYNSTEIEDLIYQTDFSDFNDGEYFFLGGFHRVKNQFGWYKGDKFTKWLEQMIVKKTNDANITFRGLYERKFKNLYATATCLNKQEMIVFSRETYPEMKIKDAVRISMSIPLYFKAVFIDSLGKIIDRPTKGQKYDVVLDGGIIGNYPIQIFDTLDYGAFGIVDRKCNPNTLGIRLDTDEQIAKDGQDKRLANMEVNNINDYFASFYTFILENLNRNQLKAEDWERTISVSTKDIGPKIRKLSKEEKNILIESGRFATALFLHQVKP